MRKYTDEFIESEILRCKGFTGVPTTIRQILPYTKLDKDVFVRYFRSHSDPDFLFGDEEKEFNKRKRVEKSKATKMERYGDENYNNREAYRNSHYSESIKHEIESVISNFDFPVTSKFLSGFLPYNFDVIENYTEFFNIKNVLHGNEATKFNNEHGIEKRIAFYREHPEQLKMRTEKSMETKLVRYGSSFYNNSGKMMETKLEKLPKLFARLFYDIEGSKKFLIENKFASREQLADYFGISFPSLENWIYRNGLSDYAPKLSNVSNKEIQLRSILHDYGFSQNNIKDIIYPFEIDIYNPNRSVGVEFNGNYWHSIKNKCESYHYDKSLLAEKVGVRLIHVYEEEWDDLTKREILLGIIRHSVDDDMEIVQCNNNTKISVLNKPESDLFMAKNNIFGCCNSDVYLGIYVNEVLYQVMSFSKTGETSWKIDRNCRKCGYDIIGGCNTLIESFINMVNPNEIYAYCDFNKFTGKTYEEFGMKLCGYTGEEKLVQCLSVDDDEKIVFGSGHKIFKWSSTKTK